MSLAVIDASAIIVILVEDSARAEAVYRRLRTGDAFYAPTLIDYEVLSALRGLARKDKRLDDDFVHECLQECDLLPIRRQHITPLRHRTWELRHNFTAYDASYVALAESLNAALVTCDEKFARVGGARCAIETIS